MKSQRRHELRENELAHALSVVRQYLKDKGSSLGLAAVIVMAVVSVLIVAVRSRATAVERVWQDKSSLRYDNPETGRASLERLRSMVNEVSDESFILASLFDIGREALRLAQLAPVPPDPTLTTWAEQAFHDLLERFPNNPLAVGVALSGLATVEENRFVLEEDLSHKARAREYLVRIIDHELLAGMPFQRIAVDRRKSLDAVFSRVRLQYPTLPDSEKVDAGKPDDPDAALVDTP